MRPHKGSDILNIPITFDTRGNARARKAGRTLWMLLTLAFWIASSIFSLIVAETWKGWLYPPVSFLVGIYIIRFIVLREWYYKKKRKELMEKDYKFSHSLFWNIYDINSRYPYFITFGTGMKGVFIAFDKDVIVGKEADYNYFHHEAIANAYQQLQKRSIEAIHIDYMDTVGKDTRMASLFQQAEKTENPDLRRVLMRMYDHIEYKMNKAYASYDVYCFYSYSREELFWDELQGVLDNFGQANYIRARALDRDEISLLVESVMNINEFSVNRANDTMFKDMINHVEYIRPIWAEKDGEREILNKTLEEIVEAKRVVQAEKKVKRKRGRILGAFKKSDDSDIDLFSSGVDKTTSESSNGTQEQEGLSKKDQRLQNKLVKQQLKEQKKEQKRQVTSKTQSSENTHNKEISDDEDIDLFD